jgi:type IV secretory pathway component VirB8
MDSYFNAARQQYAEQYGDSIVSNTYLKIAVGLLALTNLVQVWMHKRDLDRFQNFKPLVYVVDKASGRIDVQRYETLEYRPGEPELKYFLAQFCRLYYGRNRYTIQSDLERATHFMSAGLGIQVRSAWRRKQTINQFLQSRGPSIDIDVKLVAFETLGKTSKATVDYDEVYYDDERNEKQRLSYRARFTFLIPESVGPEDIQTNPIGLTITDFREDPAFDSSRPVTSSAAAPSVEADVGPQRGSKTSSAPGRGRP